MRKNKESGWWNQNRSRLKASMSYDFIIDPFCLYCRIIEYIIETAACAAFDALTQHSERWWMFEAICCSCICKPLRPLWTLRWDCDTRRHRKFSLRRHGKWERVQGKRGSCYHFGTDFSKTAACPCAHVENKSNDPLRDEPVCGEIYSRRSLLFRLPRAAPDNFSWHEKSKPTPGGPVTFTNTHTHTHEQYIYKGQDFSLMENYSEKEKSQMRSEEISQWDKMENK